MFKCKHCLLGLLATIVLFLPIGIISVGQTTIASGVIPLVDNTVLTWTSFHVVSSSCSSWTTLTGNNFTTSFADGVYTIDGTKEQGIYWSEVGGFQTTEQLNTDEPITLEMTGSVTGTGSGWGMEIALADAEKAVALTITYDAPTGLRFVNIIPRVGRYVYPLDFEYCGSFTLVANDFDLEQPHTYRLTYSERVEGSVTTASATVNVDNGTPITIDLPWTLNNPNAMLLATSRDIGDTVHASVTSLSAGTSYSISGRVLEGNGNPIAGVTISTPHNGSALTNASGNYTLSGLAASTYTLFPFKNGYTFSPPSRNVNVPPSATGQDFTSSGLLLLRLPFPHTVKDTGLNRIYSFFDHEYPLYKSEPATFAITSTIVKYNGDRKSGTIYKCTGGVSCYSGHDGYDFSKISDLLKAFDNKVPVLAAAAGDVSSGTECGLPYVKIRHGSYQTVYRHLAPNDPALQQTGHVNAGDQIGTIFVGAAPPCSTGTHLHFEVRYDRDGDGIFETIEKVDPYGFDPTKNDPWVTYGGPLSTWLWEFSRPAQIISLPGAQSSLATGNINVNMPSAAVTDPALLALMLVPDPDSNVVNSTRPVGLEAAANTVAMGSAFQLTGVYSDGGTLTMFAAPVTSTVVYSESDLSYVSEASLGLYRWDDGSSIWNLLTTTLDVAVKQAMAPIDQPGIFSLRGQPLYPPPVIQVVSPSSTDNIAGGTITVSGTNFIPTPWLNLGIAALNVYYVSSTTLTATIPAQMVPGTYDLMLRNLDGQMATLPNAFTIKSSIFLPLILRNR